MKSPYDILGISVDATPQQIFEAYRKLASLYNHVRFSDLDIEFKELAERRMEDIDGAYTSLQQLYEVQEDSVPKPIEDGANLPKMENTGKLRSTFNDVQRRIVAVEAVQRGGTFMQHGQPSEAIKELSIAIGAHPTYAIAYKLRGRSYASLDPYPYIETDQQLHEVHNIWTAFVEEVRSVNKVMFAQLDGVVPVGIDRQTIMLYAPKGEWQKKRLEQPMSTAVFDRILTKLLSRPTDTRITLDRNVVVFGAGAEGVQSSSTKPRPFQNRSDEVNHIELAANDLTAYLKLDPTASDVIDIREEITVLHERLTNIITEAEAELVRLQGQMQM